MSQKQKNIEKFLKEPIKVGDGIHIKGKGLSSRNENREELVTVEKIEGDQVFFKVYGYHELQSREINEVRKDTSHIGVDAFKKELRTNSYQIDLEQLLWRCGYEARHRVERSEKAFGVPIPEICLNPMVIDKNGIEQEYQRGLVWSLEQKQLLIESIYNHVEIGKFVLRKRSWKWVEKRVKENKIEHTAFADLVDGKQRFTAIVEFIEDKFPDLNGTYFSEFSLKAQRQFRSYRHLTYVELDENATDADTLRAFLSINFSGVPMSKEHIQYVQSIKI